MSIKWLKKIAAAIAFCVALTSLTACDNSANSAEGTVETMAEGTAETEPVAKLGFIYHGSVDEFGFTSDCNAQRIAAQQYSSIESEYIENVNVADFEKAVKLLVEDGCTHIVSGSPAFSHAINPVSQNYMNISFIDYGSSTRSVNIFAYTESIYQGAYVAGVAAAYNSESEKIGMVVDPVMLYSVPTVNAAALGTQIVYSTAQLVAATAREDNEIRNAVDALAKMGCDVIISYTESAETVDYCNKKGIKVIGNLDYTENAEDYENMLMYFYSSRDSFYLSQYKAMQLGEWQPDSYMGTLGNGVVSISDALAAAKDGTQDIMDKLIPKVASGTALIFDGQLKDVNGSIMQREGVAMSSDDIHAMTWYVQGVDISLESFIVSKDNPNSSELVIKA